ncbi:MAG: hypothetical protein KDD69_16640, partial [Bdellovibrionales bacterium]|nr:hypothetical protein [Bdellovibrionales bacterium]
VDDPTRQSVLPYQLIQLLTCKRDRYASPESLVWICQIVIGLGGILVIAGSYGAYHFGNKADEKKELVAELKQNELNNKIASLLAGNSELKDQLKPFEQIAERIYPSVKRDDALKKLAEDVDNIQEKTEELEEASERVQRKTEELEEAAAPRTITPNQRQALIRGLAPLKGETMDLIVPIGDSEAFAYAKEFLAVFESAGLTVNGVN